MSLASRLRELHHSTHVRIKTPRKLQARVKLLSLEGREALLAEFEACLYELDVRALAQSVCDDRLVFVDSDRACRVDDVASRFRVGRHGVDGAQDELLLQVWNEDEVSSALVGLD